MLNTDISMRAVRALRAASVALLVGGALGACRSPQPLAAPARILGPATGDADSRVVIDSVNDEVVLYAGPFKIPGMAAMHDMPDMPEMKMSGMDHEAGEAKENHAAHAFSPLVRFTWPVDGWYRGFRVSLVDSAGKDLPRAMMHHLVGIDFAHRQLLEGDLVRFIAAGVETKDVVLPRIIGVPMVAGQQLAIYAGWHNPGATDIDGAYIRLAMPFVRKGTLVKPISVFPVQMDVDNTPGQPDVYDLPPGKSSKAFEFQMPIAGRFLGIGGHLHDYGLELRLEDASSNDVVARVASERDATGKVQGVGRKFYPIVGLKMAAGKKYRVVGTYDAPQKDTVMNGAMAIMAGVFAPNDPSQWPKANYSDPETHADIESLPGGSKVTAPVIGQMVKRP